MQLMHGTNEFQVESSNQLIGKLVRKLTAPARKWQFLKRLYEKCLHRDRTSRQKSPGICYEPDNKRECIKKWALLNTGMILEYVLPLQGRFAKCPYEIHTFDQQRQRMFRRSVSELIAVGT